MSDTARPNPHDRFCRAVFGRTGIAVDFIANYVPAEVAARLDLSTLTLAGESMVDSDLRESFSDLLFTVMLKNGDPAAIYILFEHKSFADSMTGFQLLRYIVRIYEQRRRDGLPICCVIPIVIYHGKKAWGGPPSLAELANAPEELRRYFPAFEAIVIDVSHRSDSQLRGSAILQAILLLLKYASDEGFRDRLPGIVDLFHNVLNEPDGLECMKTVVSYIMNVSPGITRAELSRVIIISLESKGEKIVATIADVLREEGREEGRLIGQIQLFQSMLNEPETAHELLNALTHDELTKLRKELSERWNSR